MTTDDESTGVIAVTVTATTKSTTTDDNDGHHNHNHTDYDEVACRTCVHTRAGLRNPILTICDDPTAAAVAADQTIIILRLIKCFIRT